MDNYERKSVSNSVIKNSSLKNAVLDELKILEMKEIQEEENYIYHIKKQREKMEMFKYELDKKERFYSEIEQENKRLKPYYEKFNQLKDIIEETMEKMERKEKENQKFKTLLDENAKEFKKLNNILIENENNLSVWKSECEKLQRVNKETEETFYAYRQQCNEKEKVLNDQLQSFKNSERKCKDEIMQLTQENLKKIDLVTVNNSLKEQNLQLEKENIKTLELLKMTKLKIKDLEGVNEKIVKESENIKQDLNEKSMSVLNEYKDLERELDKQNQLLQKQDKQISELRGIHIEDEKRISQLKDEIILKDKELIRSKSLNNQLSEEYDSAVKKIQEFESELSEYRKENHDLKRKMAALVEKEESERIYRQELEKVKLDIISARNNEVERLNEALETVFPYSQYDKKPEDRYKSISKKINNDDRNSTNHQHHYSLTEKSE